MRTQLWYGLYAIAIVAELSVSQTADAQYAVAVVSYDAGTTPAIDFGSNLPYDVQSAALGAPSRFTDDANFPGIVSTFSPSYKRLQLLSIGEEGHVTLRLSHYVIPQADGPEIGVFTNVGVIFDFANGVAATPASAFGVDPAMVEVSEDGMTWISLGETSFDLPTNGYLDVSDPFSATPGSVLSDFQQPFTGSLSDFAGLPYSDAANPDVLDLLAGSGGGKWLDISSSGLAQVGFIRFSVTDDNDPSMPRNFELDAVSIAHTAVGVRTVPEPTTASLILLALVPLAATRRRRTGRHVG